MGKRIFFKISTGNNFRLSPQKQKLKIIESYTNFVTEEGFLYNQPTNYQLPKQMEKTGFPQFLETDSSQRNDTADQSCCQKQDKHFTRRKFSAS